jgi:hypothetical protein
VLSYAGTVLRARQGASGEVATSVVAGTRAKLEAARVRTVSQRLGSTRFHAPQGYAAVATAALEKAVLAKAKEPRCLAIVDLERAAAEDSDALESLRLVAEWANELLGGVKLNERKLLAAAHASKAQLFEVANLIVAKREGDLDAGARLAQEVAKSAAALESAQYCGGCAPVFVHKCLLYDLECSSLEAAARCYMTHPLGFGQWCAEPGCAYRATPSTGSGTDARALEEHKRTHSGERPYACDEPSCNYRATRARDLAAHMRTHSGERPHACGEPGCRYSATTAGNLKSHKRTHSGERKKLISNSCVETDCDYICSDAGSLNGACEVNVHKKCTPYNNYM